MQNQSESAVRRARLAVILTAGVLVLVLLVAVVVSFLSGNDEKMLSREEILSRVESAEEVTARPVYKYLTEFGIYGFDAVRLAEVELVYAAYYYKSDVASDFELAKGTALTFLEYFYDKIDFENKDEVTASVINCYIYALGDTWGVYRLPSEFEDYETDMSGSFVGIGVEIELNSITGEMKITYVIENSGAESAGLLAGDLIVAVDGANTASLGIDATAAKIRGESGTTVVITVLRDGERLDFTVTRALVVEESVKYSIDEEKIAYIEVKRFKANTAEQFAAALAKAKSDGARGIIFDLRGNPGGYLNAVLASLDLLVPSGTTLATYFDKTNGKVVLQSSSADSLSVPVAVICNGNTASAGELFTAGLRDFGIKFV